MTNKPDKSSPDREIGAALRDLLNRARDNARDILGLLNPNPRPALQPVPVRVPVRHPQRRAQRSIANR